ncbi:salicylate hydroxylase [Annulohypoxylon truncatum]|uniref:salicylate hydroxylase n=1 Tax=Annulohypoxylon truncatum TaxID=327061 RepID=UPI002008532F|nr:salicylate hydroxylase [Annulohypoxylon truncatum]KAI1211102.1 salicylate hydroxylase [Annulohypoxylon truncatum]
MTKPKIRIAIIGGGLAGASLANALVRHAHLEFHLYESASEFSERGAGVSLSKTAQGALEHINPAAPEILRKAGAVAQKSSRNMIGSGPHAGAVVFDLIADPKRLGLTVHRASLLRELLAPIPQERLHTNKKLDRITPKSSGCVEVVFQDGESALFDAVIGADGIFGSMRKYVLEDFPDACDPSPAGFWDCRNVVPFEKVKAALGEQFFETDRQYGWSGDGAFVIHDALEDRTMVQCAVSAIDRDPCDDRKQPLTREFLEETLKNWMDGPIGKAIIDLILDQPDAHRYSQWEFRSTPTYAKSRVCIAGDAAHAMTPWQGAGAGQAFEDAMILGTLLGNATTAVQIDAAFRAYDAVRRPRAQRIVDSSRETGLIMTGQDAEAGLDPEKLRPVLKSRWDFIYGIDFVAYKEEALVKMREFETC